MRDHADFAAYVRARWPQLVAALREEGVAAERAEEAVARALAACRPGWSRLVRESDAEAEVWRGAREEAGLATARGVVVPLTAHVEPVDPLAGVPVLDPMEAVAEQVRRRRRRGLVVAATVVGVLAVLAAAVVWWASRPPAPEVLEATNPVPVPWYADGRLHLADVVVTLPGVTALAAEGGTDQGVVVRRQGGTWWRVDPDGGVERLDGEPAGLRSATPEPPVSPGLVLGFADRVVDSVVGPDGAVVHLLDNSVAGASHGTYVRLSGTGRTAFVVCREDGTVCGRPQLATTSGETVLLR